MKKLNEKNEYKKAMNRVKKNKTDLTLTLSKVSENSREYSVLSTNPNDS